MRRRTTVFLIAAVLTLFVGAATAWWFWPREETEIVIVWQGEPKFTQQKP